MFQKILAGLALTTITFGCSSEESGSTKNYFDPSAYQVLRMTEKPNFGYVSTRAYTYDADSKCSKVTLSTNDHTEVWSKFYYNAARILQTSYGYGNQNFHYIIENGLVAEKADYNGDAVLRKFNYTYDSAKRLIKTIYWTNSPLELVNYVTYQYNSGNISRSDVFDASNELISSTLFTYDNKYNPYKNFWPKCDVESFYPHNQNNILTKKKYNASGELTNSSLYTYTYDLNGIPTSSKETFVYLESNYTGTFEETFTIQ
jgi:hypothetical protein